MIGSMGLASAIGLGLTLARPDPATVVFDGDGNLLMNLGILPLVAALGPRRFVHVVFDNEVYGSTGNQRSISREIRLDRMAEAAGYRTVAAVTGADDITEAVRVALSLRRAAFHPGQGDLRGSGGAAYPVHAARAARPLPRRRALRLPPGDEVGTKHG